MFLIKKIGLFFYDNLIGQGLIVGAIAYICIINLQIQYGLLIAAGAFIILQGFKYITKRHRFIKEQNKIFDEKVNRKSERAD